MANARNGTHALATVGGGSAGKSMISRQKTMTVPNAQGKVCEMLTKEEMREAGQAVAHVLKDDEIIAGLRDPWLWVQAVIGAVLGYIACLSVWVIFS